MNLATTFRHARALITRPDMFTSFGMACDRDGVLLVAASPRAVRWSLRGAVAYASGEWPMRAEEAAIEAAMAEVSPPGACWTQRIFDHATALAVLDKAIANTEVAGSEPKSPLARLEEAGRAHVPSFDGAEVWRGLSAADQAAIGAAVLNYAAALNTAGADPRFRGARTAAEITLLDLVVLAVPVEAWTDQCGRVRHPSPSGKRS